MAQADHEHAPSDVQSERMRSAWQDDERRALRKRRRIAGVDEAEADPPTIGLALSGGGIRSATFCLGLLRGLAQNGLLTRFDYLSTVSGGGYIGAMFGRLVASLGIHRAQAELARSDSLHLAWLRRYGRYLAPRGARDYGTAIATYMRAAIAVHVEFAFMALMLAALALLPHVMQWQWGVFEPSVWQGWRSAWWPLALGFWSLCAPGALGVYWMLRDPPPNDTGKSRRLWFRGFDLAVVIAAGIAGIALFATWIESLALPMHMPWWKWAVCLILVGLAGWGVWIQILLFRQRSRPGGVAIAITRNHLTRALRAVNAIAACMLVLGMLDWASWKLWAVLQKSQAGLFGGLGLGGVLLLLLRNANEPLQKLAMPGDGSRPGMLSWLFDFAGFGLAFALLVLWTTLAQWWVFGEKAIIECMFIDKFGWMGSVCDALDKAVSTIGAERRAGDLGATARGMMLGGEGDVFIAPGFAWLCMAAFLLLWFAGTGTNAESVNTSSLHNMYRARLVRAYFGSVNWRRFRGEREGHRGAGDPQDASNINEVVEGDDVSLRKYRPASRGGPIHLIGVCLNQTRDHRSKLYNADRKGVPLAVSAYGMEIGAGEYPAIHPAHPGTLGRWVAISGAAASPGAGANTTPGWALLLFLAGARLGVWLEHGDTALRKAVQSVGADTNGRMRRLSEAMRAHGERWFAKYMRLHAEARAAYRGPRASSWYLSDGGHFDNTGVHALLRRELDFIVLADCGADPNYHFEDIENLVRKARIDFGADIEFYSREEATRRFRSGREIGFLSQEEMADNHTRRGVLIARIAYRADATGKRKFGTLLVVKPNLHQALDSDILAYARHQPRFPQQTTGDQFFDEAQWESYHRLGEDFGLHLNRDWLEQLPGWRAAAASSHTPDSPRPLRESESSQSAPAKPFWRIEAKDAAVGALSLGALLTLALPAWQAYENFAKEREARRQELVKLVTEVEAFLEPDPARAAAMPHRWSQSFKVGRLLQLGQEFGGDSLEATMSAGLIGEIRERCAGDAANKRIPQICGHVREPGAIGGSARRNGYWSSRSVDARTEATASSPASGNSANADVAVSGRGLSGATTDKPVPAAALPPPKAVPERDPTTADSKPRDLASVPPRPAVEPLKAIEARAAARTANLNALRAKLVEVCGTSEEEQRSVVLYLQVYDEASRERMIALPWDKVSSAVQLPGVENVTITAATRNDDPPIPYASPTLLVHRWDQDQACARALRAWLAAESALPEAHIDLRRLPGRFKGRKRAIELWWPSQHRDTSRW